MSRDQADFAFLDPRRPWRMAAVVFLCIASFVSFWLAIEILSFGTADVGFAVLAAAVLSALAVIVGVWNSINRRRRYPPEERGSFRSSEVLASGITVLIAALITLGGAVGFYVNDKPAQETP